MLVTVLHYRYYIDYGLAIRGLVKHHEVDPADYGIEHFKLFVSEYAKPPKL